MCSFSLDAVGSVVVRVSLFQWARHVKGGAHLLSLRSLELGTYLLLVGQREFSSLWPELNFEPQTFCT